MTDEINEPMPVKPATAPPPLPGTTPPAAPSPIINATGPSPAVAAAITAAQALSTAVSALPVTPFRQQALIRINDAIGFLQKP